MGRNICSGKFQKNSYFFPYRHIIRNELSEITLERIQTVIFTSTVLRHHAVDFKNFRCFRKLKVRTFWWSYFWEDPRGFWDPTWWIRPYTPQAVWFRCCTMDCHSEIGSKSTWMFEKWKIRTFMIPKHETLLKTTRNYREPSLRYGSSILVSYCIPL